MGQGQEMLTLSGTHDLTPFGDFTHSPYIYGGGGGAGHSLLHMPVLGPFVLMNDSGMFAWISLTAMSWKRQYSYQLQLGIISLLVTSS